MPEKGKSPYLKYGKTPYKYLHKERNHTNTTYQSASTKMRDGTTAHWSGRVCNIVAERRNP